MQYPELNKARRINQAYENYSGPELKLNAPITRDMAADKVIERRSWFPAVETAAWFSSPQYMTRHDNMKMTQGLDLKNRHESRAMLRPGQIAQFSTYGPVQLDTTTDDNTNKWIYIIGIIVVIAIIAMLL
jgi:hypothetical protein